VTEQDERDIGRDSEDTAAEVPAEAPAETPAETPAEAAAEEPREAVAEAPAESAPEAPAESAPQAPAEAPVDAQAAPEAEAPAEPEPAEAQPAQEAAPQADGAATEQPQEASAPAAESPAPEVAPRTAADLAADARYIATGKRKSSVARVILMPGSGQFQLNGRPLEVYFPRRTHQVVVQQPLETAGYVGAVDIVARIHGGGISGQADAVRHGIAKALIEADPALRGELKRRQLLTRDPRVKERKKAGLKKARKRPQFSKR
jgi:small subunit ribosomal protein S9